LTQQSTDDIPDELKPFIDSLDLSRLKSNVEQIQKLLELMITKDNNKMEDLIRHQNARKK